MSRSLMTALLLAGLVIPVAAQQPTPPQGPPPGPPPTPCMTNPEARRFDFWVGEWTVHPAAAPTVTAGTSTVQRVSGGCALLENWRSSNGGEGKSLNAYNPALKQWQQFWIGQDGATIEFRESHWDGTTLVLLAKGPGAWQRMSFSPVDANTTRQMGESSKDEGKTWTTGYDFLYKRVK